MSAIVIDSGNFINEVINSDKPVLIDFWLLVRALPHAFAHSGGNSRRIRGQDKGRKDKHRRAASACRKYNVASIPTLILFKNGKPVNMSVGVKPKRVIEAMLS